MELNTLRLIGTGFTNFTLHSGVFRRLKTLSFESNTLLQALVFENGFGWSLESISIDG